MYNKIKRTTINNLKTNIIMALIECPECGKKVSDKANACIHCGYPLNEQKEDVGITDFHLRKTSLIDEDTIIGEIRKIRDNALKSIEEGKVRSPFPLFGYGYHW